MMPLNQLRQWTRRLRSGCMRCVMGVVPLLGNIGLEESDKL
jgi:hypothetical protein